MDRTQFQEFAALTVDELLHLQAKLTYIGRQTEPITTVAFSTLTHLIDMEAFKPLRSPGVSYANDELPSIMSFTVTAQEFQRILRGMAGLPAVRAGRRNGAYLSLMLVNDTPEGFGLEILLDRDDGRRLVATVEGSLTPENGIGLKVLGFLREILP